MNGVTIVLIIMAVFTLTELIMLSLTLYWLIQELNRFSRMTYETVDGIKEAARLVFDGKKEEKMKTRRSDIDRIASELAKKLDDVNSSFSHTRPEQ